MELVVSYEAKTVDEVKELLEFAGGSIVVKDDSLEVEVEVDVPEVPQAKAKPKAKPKVKAETPKPTPEAESIEDEESNFSIEDLKVMAVEANKKGKLSQVKDILDSKEIEKISEVPEDLINEVGQALRELVQ